MLTTPRTIQCFRTTADGSVRGLRWRRACAISACGLLIACAPLLTQAAHAQEAGAEITSHDGPAATDSNVTSSKLVDALAKRGSVTFKETPLADVILILTEQWDINIVLGDEVDGKVTSSFRNEPLEKILDSLLTANGYYYRQIGNSLVVLSGADQQNGKPSFQVEIIDAPVESIDDMEELITVLKLQMSPEGKIEPIRASKKLAIHDAPDRIEAVKALLESIVDKPPVLVSTPATEPRAMQESVVAPIGEPESTFGAIELRPQYLLATDLQNPIAMAIGAAAAAAGNDSSGTAAGGAAIGGASIAVVEEENLIVVFGDATAHRKARLLLQQLDKPRPQVRITGYIYDVDLGEIESLGVDWTQQVMSQAVDANGIPRNLSLSQGGLLTPNPPANAAQVVTGLAEDAAGAAAGAAGGAAGGVAGQAAAAGGTGGQFLFRTLNSNFELQALVQALDQTDGSRLLADPHVTVVDRHTASLGIVTQIPVQQLTQTAQGGSIGTTSFQEAGITLDVTPRIASDGTIEMQVEPTFSVLSGFQGGNPIIDQRRASTVVRVTHGQALVIGGLRSKTTVETVKGIPGLMNVKWLGALFRTHNTDVRESEMIVLIMPEIIGYCGGLDREMEALNVIQHELSSVSTPVCGPFTPDCKDKHCPQHNPRPRIHNGMQDRGLIGGYDAIFVNPNPPALYEPVIIEPEPVMTSPSDRIIAVPLTLLESEGPTQQASELVIEDEKPRSFLRRLQIKPASFRR